MDAQKLAGRHIAGVKEGETATLGIRASADLKTRLLESAKRNGRSLSAEAEIRLEQSLGGDDVGSELSAFLRLLSYAVAEIGPHVAFTAAMRTGTKAPIDAARGWLSDPTAYDQAAKGIIAALDACRPAGEPVHAKSDGIPGLDLTAVMRDLGVLTMRTWLDAVADPEQASTGTLQRQGAEIKKELGSKTVSRIRLYLDAEKDKGNHQ
jgi:TraY domain-containing protein